MPIQLWRSRFRVIPDLVKAPQSAIASRQVEAYEAVEDCHVSTVNMEKNPCKVCSMKYATAIDCRM
jgi:hypothetical protein